MATRMQRSRTRGRRVLASDRAIDDDADIMEITSVSRRRRQQQQQPTDINNANDPIDVDSMPERTCIDLTYDLNNTQDDEIVDLTSVTNVMTESPIVIMSSTETSRTRPRRRHEPIELDDTADDDLPVFDLNEDSSHSTSDHTPVAANVLADTSLQATPGQSIRCPVCFDSSRNIRTSGRRLMSTTCGHIFCSECITGAVNAQRRCPTCRKKLTLRQVHPIFL